MIRPEEAQRPFTVTELANEIRRELRPLTAMLVKGEVSGMKRGAKGHYSFAIKDGQSLINGFLYADDATAFLDRFAFWWGAPYPLLVLGLFAFPIIAGALLARR